MGVQSMASTGVMASNPIPGSSGSLMGPKRWYFSESQLRNTPTVRGGLALEKELSYRQQAANFIQDMGQRLEVTQLCINTAIVYMQRFYMFHSFTRFHRNSIASAALFLAAKVEEQPRKLEHVIKVAHLCLHRGQPQLDVRSDAYMEQAQELVTNENILLQTLGFDVAIDHPHTHVVKCCQLVKAAKELAQTSYSMATNSLHLTTMCLRYSPTTVACVCIHLACKWSNYKIPLSAQKKEWFTYIDQEVTIELLEKLTEEFLAILDKYPESRLRKKKIMNSKQGAKELEGYMPASSSGTSSGSHRQSVPSSSGRHHHHHHGHHHRSSSSSSSMAKQQQQAHANKHMNPAMFDQSMRTSSSHRDKSHSSSKSQSMVQQQQPNMIAAQQQANQAHMDYSRQQHMMHAGSSNSRSSSNQQSLVQMQQQQRHHQQQQMLQQQQRQQQQVQQQQWPQQDQRRSMDNMSLNYMQQQQQKSRSSHQSSRHSMPTDGMHHQHQQQHLQKPQQPPPLPPLPPSEPPKPQPPPPPLPPVQQTTMQAPKSIFDIDSPPAIRQ